MMRTTTLWLCGILIGCTAIAQDMTATTRPASIQELSRQLSPDGITKDEAIQIAHAAYRVLWGEPPAELKTTKCELNANKEWEITVCWDMGDVNGCAIFRIGQTGSFDSAEYIPGV